MKAHGTILVATMAVLLGATALATSAQPSINLWRGNETGADWNDAYKWKLKHAPKGIEAVHFRQQNSTIVINSTIELGNGMHLYGQELLLEGNGNINLRSPVPHQRTITIPASSSGYANLTLTDNLSVNAQIALAAKAFGTSASKGSVTLKDRTTVSGEVIIGNDGNGSGQIVLRDQSTYRITRLELDTLASKGGSAEIHILGGTARLAVGNNPFEIFLADASRKIIIGDNGTLHIESDLPVELKKRQIEKMIKQKQLLSATGCKLGTPVIRAGTILIKAERIGAPPRPATLLAVATPEPKPKEKAPAAQPPQIAKATTTETPSAPPLSGYIVFFIAFLLLLLRPVKPESSTARQGASSPADGNETREKGKGKDPDATSKVLGFPKREA